LDRDVFPCWMRVCTVNLTIIVSFETREEIVLDLPAAIEPSNPRLKRRDEIPGISTGVWVAIVQERVSGAHTRLMGVFELRLGRIWGLSLRSGLRSWCAARTCDNRWSVAGAVQENVPVVILTACQSMVEDVIYGKVSSFKIGALQFTHHHSHRS
jgi:hypothetical protein